ncbi:MAG: hypothetical protein ACJA09_001290 [Alcanivorax sp.]|jgi:hypothetical protein
MNVLPDEFLDLVPFCEKWCLSGSNERQGVRITTPMDEIQKFYDVMVERGPEALAYLDTILLGQLNSAEGNLLRLMLSLAEVAPAVEWFGQPRVIDGYEEEKFPLTLEIADLDAQ